MIESSRGQLWPPGPPRARNRHREPEAGTGTGTGTASRWAAAAFVAIVTALAVAGTWRAIVTLAAASSHADHAAHALAGDRIPTSFGTITVRRNVVLDGLTAEQLGGMTHGIQNVVLAGEAQVEIAAHLENASGGEITVDPDQFSVSLAGVQAPRRPVAGSAHAMPLPAGSSVDVTLTFVVPETGGEMALTYADPAGGRGVVIPIGRVDAAQSGEGGSHAH